MKCPKCKNYFFNKISTVYGNNAIETVYKCSKCGFEEIKKYEDKYGV